MKGSPLDEVEISVRLSMPVDCISHKRRNLHHFIYSSIQLSIHPSFHLVFSTSQWSAGTLCPLKSTHKYRFLNMDTFYKFRCFMVKRSEEEKCCML